MNNNPTVNRESFQKLLASAFVVQQSQMDVQSRSVIVELRRLITTRELDEDGAMHLRSAVNTNGVAMGPLFGTQLPLLGLEEGRSSGAFPSPLSGMLAAHDAGEVPAASALEPALNDTAEIAEIARLIDVSCAVERPTPPRSNEPPNAADSMDTCFAAPGFRTPEVKTTRLQSRDPWTPLLGIVAIALAFALGWMLGQVTAWGTARPEGPPLRVTASSDVAPAQPEVARQTDASASPVIAPESRSPKAELNSPRSQH